MLVARQHAHAPDALLHRSEAGVHLRHLRRGIRGGVQTAARRPGPRAEPPAQESRRLVGRVRVVSAAAAGIRAKRRAAVAAAAPPIRAMLPMAAAAAAVAARSIPAPALPPEVPRGPAAAPPGARMMHPGDGAAVPRAAERCLVHAAVVHPGAPREALRGAGARPVRAEALLRRGVPSGSGTSAEQPRGGGGGERGLVQPAAVRLQPEKLLELLLLRVERRRVRRLIHLRHPLLTDGSRGVPGVPRVPPPTPLRGAQVPHHRRRRVRAAALLHRRHHARGRDAEAHRRHLIERAGGTQTPLVAA